MRKSLLLALAALACGSAVAATTTAPVETVSISVPYGDLDIASPAGTAILNSRIDAAASKICEKPDIRSVRQMAAWEECMASAKAGALEQLSILEPYQSLALSSEF